MHHGKRIAIPQCHDYILADLYTRVYGGWGLIACMETFTVLVQIFEGRIFRGCHKFSIFAILFSRITGFHIGRLCAHYYEI